MSMNAYEIRLETLKLAKDLVLGQKAGQHFSLGATEWEPSKKDLDNLVTNFNTSELSESKLVSRVQQTYKDLYKIVEDKKDTRTNLEKFRESDSNLFVVKRVTKPDGRKNYLVSGPNIELGELTIESASIIGNALNGAFELGAREILRLNQDNIMN